MALSTVFLWGASFPLTKAALAYTGPTAIAFLRWAISALALLGWLAWQQRRRTPGPGLRSAGDLLRYEWHTLAWVALTGIALFYFLENLALRYTTATNAGVLANLTSVFMVFIGASLLRERLSGLEWGALGAALLGAVLVSQGAGHLVLGGPGLLGDGLMVIASFFGAVYSIGGKRLAERYPAAVVTTLVAASGALMLLPLALLEGLRLNLPWHMWGFLLLLGLGSGALANLWWLMLLARTRASRAALILFLIPVISAALSVTLLGEPLTLTTVGGAALVLVGMFVVQQTT